MSKMLITDKQYNHLSSIGREIHDYWMQYKPTMYQEMHEAGTLWEILSSEDNRLLELMCSLITEQGLAEDQAWEIIRSEIYVDPEEIEEELEETEQDRRAQEMWEIFVETQQLKEEANALRFECEDNPNEEMELNACRNERIRDIYSVLDAYRAASALKKSERVLLFLLFLCAVVMYFAFSDWFGDTLGYIFTIAIVMINVCCLNKLWIAASNTTTSDGVLAYQACIAMEALIELKNKNNSAPNIARIAHIEQGKHQKLYEEFAKLYPELACNDLQRLALTTVTYKDIYG